MSAIELARLINDMRTAQRRWFGGDRSSHVLQESKRLEREVDRAVKAVLSRETQGGLFAPEGAEA